MTDPENISLSSAVPSEDLPATQSGTGRIGTGGRLKVEPEDFRVEEIPCYEPSGEGDHLFLWIRKRDVSSEMLIETISRTLNLPRDAIGVAGMKDRRAVTQQWVSIPASAESEVSRLDSEAIQVIRSVRHGNKLKTGHLRGNRFEIVIRDVIPDAFQRAEAIRKQVEKQGIPNEFGEQRFGNHGQTLSLGLALLKGTASPQSIPYRRRKFLVKLSLSAAQSLLFNRVVRRRGELGLLHTVLAGDVMQVRGSGGLFIAEETAIEQLRQERREIQITGPLFGPKMKSPLHDAFALEQEILDEEGISRDLFRTHKKFTQGGRRPVIMFPEDLSCAQVPEGLCLKFTLPSGSYATVILRTFMGIVHEQEDGQSETETEEHGPPPDDADPQNPPQQD